MFKWTTEVRTIIIDYESIYNLYGNIDLSLLPSNIRKIVLYQTNDNFKGLNENDLRINDTPSHFLIEKLFDYLTENNQNSSNIIFISANFEDTLLYQQKRFGSILIETLSFDYKHISSAPDLIITNWNELKNIDFQRVGYTGELIASNTSYNYGYFLISELNGFEIYSSGRYYKSKNHYLSQDVFSLKIINFKKLNPHIRNIEMMNHIYCSMIDLSIQNNHSFNCVVSVPNRPGQFDRFKKTREYICSKYIGVKDCNDQLTCIKDYKSQKSCTAEERTENIRNAFIVNGSFQGKDVILIDDIISTGSTVTEICKLLKKNGANSICIFTLAVNQLYEMNFIQPFKNIKCPSCDGEFILKYNTKTGEVFFGCSHFTNGCMKSCSLEEGQKVLKQMNLYKPIIIPLDFEY